MGKENAVKIKYMNGALPSELRALLDKADDADLRVLLTLTMLADADTAVAPVDGLCDILSLDGGEVAASLKFWRGAGVIENASRCPSKKKTGTASETSLSVAHRRGAVEQSSRTDDYSTRELADIMEKHVVSPQFIDEAQRVMGKMFRTYDIGILVGIVERLGFEEEAVLLMLNYAVGKGKRTMRYAETLAMALYDDGITDVSAVSERLGRMERSREVIEQIKAMYGVGGRELTTTEKRLFTAWTEKFVYDIEVIRMAFDITVDNKQKAIPKYANTILEHWYSEGLRTADEVRKYLERQSAERGGTATAKSYDADDFFEAALRRSYEELKD